MAEQRGIPMINSLDWLKSENTPELIEHEVLCERCSGSGRINTLYGAPRSGGGPGVLSQPCPDCDGDGKRLKCAHCGYLCKHGNKFEEPLCISCLKATMKNP